MSLLNSKIANNFLSFIYASENFGTYFSTYRMQFYNLPCKRAQLNFWVLKIVCHVSRLLGDTLSSTHKNVIKTVIRPDQTISHYNNEPKKYKKRCVSAVDITDIT